MITFDRTGERCAPPPGRGVDADVPATAGLGVPCPDAQADGVPCMGLGIPCAECARRSMSEAARDPWPDDLLA